jgi:hypothetical protein
LNLINVVFRHKLGQRFHPKDKSQIKKENIPKNTYNLDGGLSNDSMNLRKVDFGYTRCPIIVYVNLEEIHGFSSIIEFNNFVKRIQNLIEDGLVEEIAVDPSYGAGLIYGGRWFRCKGWEVNRMWLDRCIARGDTFYLGSNALEHLKGTSYFSKGLQYMISQGYRIVGNYSVKF